MTHQTNANDTNTRERETDVDEANEREPDEDVSKESEIDPPNERTQNTNASPEDQPPVTAHPTQTENDGQSPEMTVTPYAVEGAVDYEKLLEQFGADPLTDEQIHRLPDHPSVRRRIFYAGRDVDRYLAAAEADEDHAIVTGIGPSGPLHLGHVLPLYLAKRFQEATGATVYLPFSDDEKYLAKDQSFESIGDHTRENLRDVLAVGFDPDRTRIVIDTADADVIYPIAVRLAKGLTPATIDAVYGEGPNVGLSFYPAVQATHLLLPQLVAGRQPTLIPIAIDQDPHVRVCRDLAGKEELPVEKPGALLGRFLPSLDGPGKMSSSERAGESPGDSAGKSASDSAGGTAPSIELGDDREMVARKIRDYAYTGGAETVEAHRERGGDPAVDVPFQYLRFGFEPDDETLDRIAADYRSGDLLSGELKEIAIERIAEFLDAHQHRRSELGGLEEELRPYRLCESERTRALESVGVSRIE